MLTDLIPLKQTLILVAPPTFKTLVVCPMGRMLNEFVSIFLICDITDKIVITSFLVNKQVDQGL